MQQTGFHTYFLLLRLNYQFIYSNHKIPVDAYINYPTSLSDIHHAKGYDLFCMSTAKTNLLSTNT